MTDTHKFSEHIKKCLLEADQKYGTSLAGNVEVRYDLRGSCAGMAGWKRKGLVKELYLRFNLEAMDIDWENMVADTIPHEVAHLVTYVRPELGKNHDRGWRNLAISLGSTGKRTHNLKLTPGRRTKKYRYKGSCGTVITVGGVVHKRLQAGQTRTITRTGGKISRHDYLGEATTSPTVAERKPTPKRDSKADLCQRLIRKWLDKYSEEHILASEGFAFTVKRDCKYPSMSQAKSALRSNMQVVKSSM